jgi:acetyl-CoA carboxylase, biotin carboxylase subunit
MRVCRNEASLRSNIKAAQQEAQAAFGNGAVFIEKFLEHARHVEVQVPRRQARPRGPPLRARLLDAAPPPEAHRGGTRPGRRPQEDRRRLREAAARLIRSADYAGAATVEFLMDDKQNFYMLEVNTRVQVEHPVTEMITGVDIVKMSIRIAAGEALPFRQRDIQVGATPSSAASTPRTPTQLHAQRRPDRDLGTPRRPGRPPGHPRRPGYRVPPNYDSMIGKLIVPRRRPRAGDRAHQRGPCASSASGRSRPPSPSTRALWSTRTSATGAWTSISWSGC